MSHHEVADDWGLLTSKTDSHIGIPFAASWLYPTTPNLSSNEWLVLLLSKRECVHILIDVYAFFGIRPSVCDGAADVSRGSKEGDVGGGGGGGGVKVFGPWGDAAGARAESAIQSRAARAPATLDTNDSRTQLTIFTLHANHLTLTR